MAKAIERVTYSQVFAFLGNSLLSPMKQTSDAGMDRHRAEEASGCLSTDGVYGDEAVRAFTESHPLGWIETLRRAVQESHPQGYIDGILGVAEASLTFLSADLR